MTRFVEPRPLGDPKIAARRLVEIANTIEPVQDGRIHIEKINEPFLREGGLPAEYGAGLARAIERGWLWKHESGTYLKLTPAAKDRRHTGKVTSFRHGTSPLFLPPPIEWGLFKKYPLFPVAASAYWSIATMIA